MNTELVEHGHFFLMSLALSLPIINKDISSDKSLSSKIGCHKILDCLKLQNSYFSFPKLETFYSSCPMGFFLLKIGTLRPVFQVLGSTPFAPPIKSVILLHIERVCREEFWKAMYSWDSMFAFFWKAYISGTVCDIF